jgi:protein SCO1/2/putative membrane protein
MPTLPEWVSWLPTVNASLNGLATVLLIVGHRLIYRKRIEAHKRVMLSAFGVSVIFLASYVTYHAYAGSKPFTGTGLARPVYFTILISHIVLAALVPLLAAVTIHRGLTGQWDKHRRIARVTYPIWLYVSVTGVIIYLMLYHWAV